jgi:4-hydroxybenzoate polyprenyltransferase
MDLPMSGKMKPGLPNLGKMRAWAEFLRLPNLPSAPGDALAGAALGPVAALCDSAVSPAGIVAAAFAALLLYAGGLADNDIVDAGKDRASAPQRPLPSGRISLPAARTARAALFLAAFAIGFAVRLPRAWFLAAAATMGLVLLYNRAKDAFPKTGCLLMGLCRGGSFVAGAAAVLPCPWPEFPVVIFAVAAGWTAYVASLTALASNEENAAGPLGPARHLGAVAALLPAIAFFAWQGGIAWRTASVAAGSLAAALVWMAAVHPLGRPHGPDARRRAVGKTIGALLYLQAGFVLLPPWPWESLVLLAACFAARFLVRRRLPALTGS